MKPNKREKRRILILDAFTNGHEATLAFIKQQGWNEEDCTLVFCGTHNKLLQQLSQGPAYAVVPIKNSIAGEIMEVTTVIESLRETGYQLLVRDTLSLTVIHCLLAPRHITDVREVKQVLSHEKAHQQCGKFLGSIGIDPAHRILSTSTGNAAKVVSRLGPAAKTAAIAPKAAAEEYGLTILAEGIQDTCDNTTTFLLLENKSVVESVTVGIIGIGGGVGRRFDELFTRIGCHVIGSDINNPGGRLSNRQVVEQSDVIIVTVPIRVTPEVIREIAPYVQESQLLMDVTSIKGPAVEAMLKSSAQVVGLHPMFRPDVSFSGQKIVVHPARLSDARWKTWVVNMLAATQANLKWATSTEHDRYMLPVQVNTHTGNLVNALTIVELGISVSESLDYASPFYRIALALMARLVSQNPGLYSDILIENPGTVELLERRIAIEQRLLQLIQNHDYAAFEALFARAQEHFGLEVTGDANTLFTRLIGVLSTLYGQNSLILEFPAASNQPGLLLQILKAFNTYGVNLIGIHSTFLGEKLQFMINLEQSRASNAVRQALEAIESWSDPQATIIME